MRPLQDVVNLRLTALCIADRLSCLYRSRDLVHHSFFPGSQIKGSNANRNNIKTDNISHTSGTGSPALLPSLASYCFMVTSGIKAGAKLSFAPPKLFCGKTLVRAARPVCHGAASAQYRAQLLFQSFQNRFHIGVRLFGGQAAVVSPEDQVEGHRLLALGHAPCPDRCRTG